MSLINEEKIVEKSWRLSCDVSDKFETLGPLVSSISGVEAGKGFSLGVRFAEEELKRLAIEFAKYVINNNFSDEQGTDFEYDFNEFVEQFKNN